MTQQRPEKKGEKKDKQKVIGEVFTDAQLKSFLDYRPADDQHVDFHIFIKAYRGLPPEAFARFVQLYLAAGHDVNASNAEGVLFVDYIRSNESHPEYVAILEEAGAASTT